MAARNKSDSFEVEKCLMNYKHLFCPSLLRDKVAFVTGGGSGIGFTIAEIFMRHGCHIAIASRNLAKLQAAKRILENAVPDRKCFVAQMDVRKPDQVKDCVNKILSEYNRLDILVNNSAGNFLCLAESLSTNAFRNVIDIDAVGTFTVSKTVYEAYFKIKYNPGVKSVLGTKAHGGVIVNITATLHINASPMQSHAGSAKAAIDALTRHLAVEWGPNDVRVIGVAPGPVADTVGYSKLGGSMVSEEMIASRIPLQRVGRRVDVANAVLYLASEAASNVTGTVLVVDGGNVLTAGAGLSSLLKTVGGGPRL